MRDYEAMAASAQRKRQIARFAPGCCAAYRQLRCITQAELARRLGTTGSLISALEGGHVRNFTVAEAVIILNGEDMALLQISETPGLRERLERMQRDGLPINMTMAD